MMKSHAYLILAHTNFNQLKKLVSLLDDERNDIFVHVDGSAKFDGEGWEDVCRHSGLYFIEDRIRVSWGGVSIMRAELKLLKAATAKGHYKYYHLLSGMDLPIKPQDEIHAFFEKNDGKEFINYWQFKNTTKSRFHYYTIFPEGSRFFLTNLINNIGKGVQMALGIKMNRDVDFKLSAQWFSITDGLARYVVSEEVWLEKVFKHTSICDEVFLATVAWRSEYKNNLYDPEFAVANTLNNSNMRFIDWTRGKSIRHPWTFLADDFDLLMSVPHFWARKFDERVDSEIIDKVYKALKKKD